MEQDSFALLQRSDKPEKHVLNSPQTLVVDSLKGLVALNPNIKLDEAQRGEQPHHHSSFARLPSLQQGWSVAASAKD
jgi:hypothetical protein